METIKIHIRASSNAGEELASIFSANFDNVVIEVEENPTAVKGHIPFLLEIIVGGTSVYFLEKLVLDPIFKALASKWNEFTQNHWRPFQPLHIFVRLQNGDVLINSDPLYEQSFFQKSIHYLPQAMSTLREQGLAATTSKMRLIVDHQDQLKIIYYESSNKPAGVVDIENRILIDLTESEQDELIEPSNKAEAWLAEKLREGELYDRQINKLRSNSQSK